MASDALHGRYAVSIGEALYDCLADQKGVEKEDVKSWTPHPGGAPVNVATGISRLGIKSVFLGAIGADDLGKDFIQLLKDREVDTSHIQLEEDRPTRDILVTRSLDGDRTFAGFGKRRTEEYADCFLDPEKLPLDVVKNADVLVTGTLGLATGPTAGAIRKAVEVAKEGRKCTVMVDVNWRPVFWSDLDQAKKVVEEYVHQADVVKLTDEEAEWLFGIGRDAALNQPEKVLENLPHAKGVLVSAGEKGSAYSFRSPGGKMDLSGVVPVLSVDVVDTTGAGDAYTAGFLFYMLLSGSLDSLLADPTRLRRAVEFATACGAATCTKPGAIGAQPTVAEVEQLLAAKDKNK
ncbi:hypothetical protein N2152v2_010590 [Parachlorella kessleri]